MTLSHVIAFDTETELMRPGMMAPELVCLTWQEVRDGRRTSSNIVDRHGAHTRFFNILISDAIIVGQNVAYDTAVICAEFPDLVPLVFQAYKDNRITDTKIRQQLIDIGRGCYRGYLDEEGVWHKLGYSLFDLVRRHCGGRLLQKDGWRLRYGEFRDVPLSSWVDKAKELQAQAKVLLEREAYKPEAQRYYDGHDPKDLLAILNDDPQRVLQYPLDDATTTLDVFLAQDTEDNQPYLVNQFAETYYAFCLHLAEVWGVRTSPEGVAQLEATTAKALEEITAQLVAEGLVRPDGSRDTKKAAAYMELVCEREGLPLRKTAKGGICLDKEACDAVDDELLDAYAAFTQLGKTENADLPMLRGGLVYPVHCHFDLADTSRTTCSKPNLQNIRRGLGIRECFVPRKGRVYIQADFPQLELYTLAQVCYSRFGHSALGEMLKAGIDPHTAFAAKLAGVSYEEGVRLNKAKNKLFYNKRQVAKAFNFGKPGGLGNKKLVQLAASPAYRVTITLREAKEYSAEWLDMLPEMVEYFAYVDESMDEFGLATVEVPVSRHVRGGARFCAACNTPFQGLGARCAKSALALVAEAEYTQPESPLYGARTVLMVHDELIAEADEDKADGAARELARLMVEGANLFLPDCPIQINRMEPTVMALWSKDARPYEYQNRLVPWSPELEGCMGFANALKGLAA